MRPIRFALFALVATLSFSQQVSDPWPEDSVIEPAAFASELQSGKTPNVICVAFPQLYAQKHILHASFAGPGSKPEGLEALKKAAEPLARDADLVIYCGCCPMANKCPNIRPAYRTLKEMGFTHIRVLHLATNTETDWFSKDYPSEAGTAATAPTSSQN
ncbi:MAG TPA: rhodanese-like domain-containing protein [Bryobacteraceae bacterium]|nr:rhodanese-like domain-containing protein [Bryobacteraceae bacterium]